MPNEVSELLTVVGAVLHLGQQQYTSLSTETCELTHPGPAYHVATLLDIPVEMLTDALTHRTVASRGESIKSPLNVSQAVYARDALAKSMCVLPFWRGFLCYYCYYCVCVCVFSTTVDMLSGLT